MVRSRRATCLLIVKKLLVALSFVWVLNVASALEVRVDPAGGAPRLVVNGEPVRARMFWGAPGSAPIPITTDWRSIEFEFKAGADATNGTLHFRFGHQAGNVELRDITIDDQAVRDWTVWPTHLDGAVRREGGALNVAITAPANGQWPDFHVYSKPNLKITKDRAYHVRFRARASTSRDLTVAVYRPGQPYVRLGGPQDVFAAQIKLATAAEVNFVSFPVPLPWPKPGETVDWTGVETACETVLRANPHALLLPRIGLDPPSWWRAAHPDDVMQWDDGTRSHAVPASPTYRRDAAERLTALVTYLEEHYGEHVAGYHPVGQNTGEWFYEGTWKRPLNGYAPADLAAWRRWLQAHGKTEVPVPSPAERRSADVFASPAVADWNQFQQDAMAGCIRDLAHAARQASRGRKLVVFFYGYVFEFGPVANGPATSGHYALRQVLDCPDIDVLCSPISYFDRGLGQSAPSMTAAESVALAGKLWLNEDDTHTYLATGTQPGSRDHVRTREESNAELLRNVAQESLRNFGTWWMDLGATGWFNDAALWTDMKRMQKIDDWFLKHPTPFRPEVAAVIDEASVLRVAAGGQRVTRTTLYEIRAPLGRMGAPYGQYLLDDVVTGRVQAKLFVFVNGWSYSAEERARLTRIAGGAALFVETTGVTTAALRQAARAAGVHLFTETDCIVYANARFLTLHGVQDGPVVVRTGARGPVQDALSGAVIGQGPEFSLPLKRGETRVVEFAPGRL